MTTKMQVSPMYKPLTINYTVLVVHYRQLEPRAQPLSAVAVAVPGLWWHCHWQLTPTLSLSPSLTSLQKKYIAKQRLPKFTPDADRSSLSQHCNQDPLLLSLIGELWSEFPPSMIILQSAVMNTSYVYDQPSCSHLEAYSVGVAAIITTAIFVSP